MASRRPARPRWIWPAAASGVLAFALMAALASGVFRVKTTNGTIVIENLPANAVVDVDGERITIRPPAGEPLSIETKAGKHFVVVKWRDAPLLNESVTVESGKQFKLAVRLDPPGANEKKSPAESQTGAVATQRDEPGNPSVPQEREERPRRTSCCLPWTGPPRPSST